MVRLVEEPYYFKDNKYVRRGQCTYGEANVNILASIL